MKIWRNAPYLKNRALTCALPCASSPHSLNFAPAGAQTPLQLAVDAGARGGDLAAVPRSARRASVEVLLARGADPNCADKLGNTVLLSAARAGDWGAVCRLRRAGADAGVTNQEGDTAARLVARPELNLGWRHRAAAAFALHAPTWALAPLEPLCWDRREGNP